LFLGLCRSFSTRKAI